MTVQECNNHLISLLQPLYEQREAQLIAALVVESVTGYSPTQRIIHKNELLNSEKDSLLQRYSKELVAGRPVQYVLGAAWFEGMKFFVDERVLIPRPETEELAEWILSDYKTQSHLRVADIGTGSGCIAITLQKKLDRAAVIAYDKSNAALEVAALNARSNGADLRLMQTDILDPAQNKLLPQLDIIVSNPPYIPAREKTGMAIHVSRYEPPEALFVPDSDPLIFYRVIAELAGEKLGKGGTIYAELHEDYALEVEKLYRGMRFGSVELRKDMHGKWRMIKATMLL